MERQFYLLLPLALIAVGKWGGGRRSVAPVLIGIFVLSLGLSIGVTFMRPTAAFYLLPTRAWEMLAGGLVYLLACRFVPTTRQSTLLEALGMALVAGAVAAFDGGSAWPGWRAIFPVAGPANTILAARLRLCQ